MTVRDLRQEAITTSGNHFYLYYAVKKSETEYMELNREIEEFDPQIQYPDHLQNLAYHLAFSRRIFRAEVNIVLTVSSLVEAMANVFLSKHAAAETFSVLERATPIEKWETLPKLYIQNYSLPKGETTYRIFKLLNQRRNCLTHPKPRIEKGGAILHKGNLFEPTPDEFKLHQQFCALPLMLTENMKKFDIGEASHLDIMFLMSESQTLLYK